jgi:hypothetical protein
MIGKAGATQFSMGKALGNGVFRSLAPGAASGRKTNHGSEELPNPKNAEHIHGTS